MSIKKNPLTSHLPVFNIQRLETGYIMLQVPRYLTGSVAIQPATFGVVTVVLIAIRIFWHSYAMLTDECNYWHLKEGYLQGQGVHYSYSV